jgi:hypothetical protein
MFVFGGSSEAGRLNDVHALCERMLVLLVLLCCCLGCHVCVVVTESDASGVWQWFDVMTQGAPPRPRTGHASCVLRWNVIVVFGGNDGTDDLADLHLLVVTAPTTQGTWLVLPPAGMHDASPPARRFHTLVSHENSELAVMFGGCVDREYNALCDLWVLTGVSVTAHGHATSLWVDMTGRASGPPPRPRWGHAAVMVSIIRAMRAGL